MLKKNKFKRIVFREEDYINQNDTNIKKDNLSLKNAKNKTIIDFTKVEILEKITDKPLKIITVESVKKKSIETIKIHEEKVIKKHSPDPQSPIYNIVFDENKSLKEKESINKQSNQNFSKNSKINNDLPQTKIRYIDIIIEREQKYSSLNNGETIEESKNLKNEQLNNQEIISVEDKIEQNMNEMKKDLFLNEIRDVNYNSDNTNHKITNKPDNVIPPNLGGKREEIKRKIDPNSWKRTHKGYLKNNEELNMLSLYDLIVYLNTIDPNILSNQEQDRLLSTIKSKIVFLKKLIFENDEKTFLIANYNVAGALVKLLTNLRKKIRI